MFKSKLPALIVGLLSLTGIMLVSASDVQAVACQSVAQIFVQLATGSRRLMPGESVDCTATATKAGAACTPYGRTTDSCSFEGMGSCVMPQGPYGFDCSKSPYIVNCTLNSSYSPGWSTRASRSLVNGQWNRVDIVLPTLQPTATPTPTRIPLPPTATPTPDWCQNCGTHPEYCIQYNCGNACNANGVCYFIGNPTPTLRPPTATPMPQCYQTCNSNIDCQYVQGCTACINHQCVPPPPTATATPAVCQEGAQCRTNADCNGGACSQKNPVTGIGVCNCQGGGCVPGNSCSPPKNGPTPTPLPNGDICYYFQWGAVTAECCAEGRNWTINKCLINSPTPAQGTPTPTTVATATPRPTNTPWPTKAPSPTITPTPTPVQPTAEVTMAPTPTVNPNVPTPTPRSGTNPVAGLSQRWVCLDSVPCSAGGCSGMGTPDHRVKVSAKTDGAKPLSGTDTYVFECLQVPDPARPGRTMRKCTTGVQGLDNVTVGSNILPDLQRNNGYEYSGIFYSDGATNALNPVPPRENNNGDFGYREWESFTRDNIDRMFLAMNWYDPNGPQAGNAASQKQGTLDFDDKSKKCIMIRWDPKGIIFDSASMRPIAGAEVTLLKKLADGRFVPVTDDDVLGGGLQNPFVTKDDGAFTFYVPDGTYKLVVKKDGYAYPAKTATGRDYLTYKNIYYGQEFTQQGKMHEYDIPLDPDFSALFRQSLGSLLQKAVNAFIK